MHPKPGDSIPNQKDSNPPVLGLGFDPDPGGLAAWDFDPARGFDPGATHGVWDRIQASADQVRTRDSIPVGLRGFDPKT